MRGAVAGKVCGGVGTPAFRAGLFARLLLLHFAPVFRTGILLPDFAPVFSASHSAAICKAEACSCCRASAPRMIALFSPSISDAAIRSAVSVTGRFPSQSGTGIPFFIATAVMISPSMDNHFAGDPINLFSTGISQSSSTACNMLTLAPFIAAFLKRAARSGASERQGGKPVNTKDIYNKALSLVKN